jgi:hypothetical protein
VLGKATALRYGTESKKMMSFDLTHKVKSTELGERRNVLPVGIDIDLMILRWVCNQSNRVAINPINTIRREGFRL